MLESSAVTPQRRKVWIDLTNSPHVLFFRPVIRRLDEAGVETVVTARDFAQTLGLLERYGIDHTVIGHAVYDGHQPVVVESNSLIAKATGATDLMVNSIHHQAVKDLAPGFRAVAWANDGIIEGIEHEDERWPLLAVQWHPEYLSSNSDEVSHRLFEGFVDSASLA